MVIAFPPAGALQQGFVEHQVIRSKSRVTCILGYQILDTFGPHLSKRPFRKRVNGARDWSIMGKKATRGQREGKGKKDCDRHVGVGGTVSEIQPTQGGLDWFRGFMAVISVSIGSISSWGISSWGRGSWRRDFTWNSRRHGQLKGCCMTAGNEGNDTAQEHFLEGKGGRGDLTKDVGHTANGNRRQVRVREMHNLHGREEAEPVPKWDDKLLTGITVRQSRQSGGRRDAFRVQKDLEVPEVFLGRVHRKDTRDGLGDMGFATGTGKDALGRRRSKHGERENRQQQ
jgi:hypothetical protein